MSNPAPSNPDVAALRRLPGCVVRCGCSVATGIPSRASVRMLFRSATREPPGEQALGLPLWIPVWLPERGNGRSLPRPCTAVALRPAKEADDVKRGITTFLCAAALTLAG